MQLAFDSTDVEVMTTFDMIQSEAVVFQDPDNITVRPVESTTRHSILHASKSVVSNLNGRRNRFVSCKFVPEVEILRIGFLIEWCGA